MGGVLQVRWTLDLGDEESAEALASELNAAGGSVGVEQPAKSGFAFLPIIAGAIATVALAEALVKFRRRRQAEAREDAERELGGWLVDTTTGTAVITRNATIPYPVIVVRNSDGEEVSIDTSLEEDQQTSTIADLLAAAVAAAG